MKVLYGHVKDNLATNMGTLGYSRLAPDFNNTRILHPSPGQYAMYVPLFFNKQTGDYLHLLVMKSGSRIKSMVILLEPDKSWYQERQPLDKYVFMDGRISYFNSSGIFRQSFSVVDGLVAADGTLDLKRSNSQDLASLPALSNDLQVTPQASSIMSMSAACNSCHTPDPGDPADPCEGRWGEFGCGELGPVVVISNPPGFPPFIFPPLPDPSIPRPSPWTGYPPYPGGGPVITPPDNDDFQCCQFAGAEILSEPIAENISVDREPAFINYSGDTINNWKMNWYFNKNTWLFWEWKYKSSESAWLERKQGQWKFTSLAHQTIIPVGTIPPCTEYDFDLLEATPSLEYNRTMARMTLHYAASYRFNCPASSAKRLIDDKASNFWMSE